VTIGGVVTSLQIAPNPTAADSGSPNSKDGHSDSPTTPNDPADGPPGSRSPPIGPIVGAVIGLILIILLILLLFIRRRRQHRTTSNATQQPAPDEEAVTPFNTNPEMSTTLGPTLEPTVQRRPTLLAISHKASLYPSEKILEGDHSLDLDTNHPPDIPPGLSPSDEEKGRSNSDISTPPSTIPALLPAHLGFSDPNPSQASMAPRQSGSRPPSSFVGSEIAPAYVRDPNRPFYRSGTTTLFDGRASWQMLDIPPSYESVRNVDSSTSS